MLAWKIAPALACGNTVVLKPAETTPLTALLFAEVCQQADLPPGVVNIVTGAGATGRAIVEHPDIDKVAFTGSTEVGKMIARSVAGTRKKVTLELGGKAANIVFDDAPIDQAVEGIVNGIFFNQGHVCCAGSPAAGAGEHRRRRRRPAQAAAGHPAGRRPDGQEHRRRRDQLGRAARPHRGAGGGRRGRGCRALAPACELPTNGFWFRPTVFSGVSQTHRIAQEEIFGPVVSVLTFRTPAEAVAKANNTPYGLSAGIWTEKGSRILWMADQLRAGVVWANTFNKFDPTSPFGGYKESGYGREGGRHGLEAYVTTGGPSEHAGRRPQDVQALHRREVPPQRERSLLRGVAAGAARRGFLAHRSSSRRALGSRKDARDAVVAARKAQPGWAGATAYNRGQVLYRVAEVMESRRGAVRAGRARQRGPDPRARPRPSVSRRSTAGSGTPGWSDKFTQVLGGLNPVAGPYFDISAPEATGVVGGARAPGSSLLGLVSVVAPVIVSGNTAVVLTSEDRPLPAITLAECLATSDVPGGVVNIVTGRTAEMAPWLASHRDVNAIDLTGAAGADGVDWGRSRRPRPRTSSGCCARRHRRRGGRARLLGDARPVPAHGVPRDQDGLAPQGPLTRAGYCRPGRHAGIRRWSPVATRRTDSTRADTSSTRRGARTSVTDAAVTDSSHGRAPHVVAQHDPAHPQPGGVQTRPPIGGDAQLDDVVGVRGHCVHLPFGEVLPKRCDGVSASTGP